MQSCLRPSVERVRPWLGTLVSIRVEGLPEGDAGAAIEEAFTAIRRVHEGMSFHRPESELSYLNRNAHRVPVQVSDDLWKVLQFSGMLSGETGGAFDVTVAPSLVDAGFLPLPCQEEVSGGTWPDVELRAGNRVFFRRPLWIDLGGIAKGYAVDCAAEALAGWRPLSAVVNAGGDLRIVGKVAQRIALRVDHRDESRALPILTVSSAGVASSCTSSTPGVHIDGGRRLPLHTGLFVSVVAETCMAADALTKAVLTDREASLSALRSLRAQAYVHEIHAGWSRLQ